MNAFRTLGAFALLFLATILLAGDSLAAPEDTLTVNSFVDSPDANPGDGICATAAGECTLRAAVMEANALPGDEIIILRSGVYALSRAGANEDNAATGDLDIRTNVTIDGAGENNTVISGEDEDRVFHVIGAVNLALAGVTVQNGNAQGSSSQGDGGGIRVEQGASLQMFDATLKSNTAGHYGGGLFVDTGSSAELTKVTVIDNEAEALGGGLDNYQGTLTIQGSDIRNNTTTQGPGGGLYNGADAVTTINESTFDDNEALDGGGIYNYAGRFISGGHLEISNSTISNNTASQNGGGIFNFGDIHKIENVTISGNDAQSNGGGLYNQGAITDPDDPVNRAGIHHTTIAYNIANAQGGGIYNEIDDPLTIKNSIVAENTQEDCFLDDDQDFTSYGHNIQSDASCDFDAATDKSGQDTLLGILQDNGGPTWTHFPAADSPAVDMASAADTPNTDQRGVARPQGSGRDIGAVEHNVADLTISKSAAPQIIYAGTEMTYSIVVINDGESLAQNIVMNDILPETVTFVSAEGGATTTCGIVDNVVTCSQAQLAVGARLDIEIVVTAPDEGGDIENTAMVSSVVTDDNEDDNTTTITTFITAEADLSVSKTAEVDEINAGDLLSYELVATNEGPSSAENVTVTDVLPAGTSFESAEGDGWTCAFNEVTSTVSCVQAGAMAVGDAPPITLNLFVPAGGGPLSNTATVASDTVDLTSDNDSDTAVVQVVTKADLRVLKSVTPNPVYALDEITYLLELDNLGPSAAANVVVTDTLPTGTEFISATGDMTCGYHSDEHQVICTVPTFPSSSPSLEVEIVVLATVDAATLTNVVEISSDAVDTDLSNNVATVDVDVLPVSDLEISQTHAPDPVLAGRQLSYFLHVENAGPSLAHDVTVQSVLPQDVTILGASGTGWTCGAVVPSNNSITCTRSQLAVGTAPDIEVIVQAPDEGGTTVNTATVGSSSVDFDPDDNSSVEDVSVIAVADLQITLSDSPDPVDTDAPLVYTLSVHNNGPSRAEMLVVTQTLPTEVTFVSATGEDWDCEHDDNFNIVHCTFTTLPAGETTTIDVVVTTPDDVTILDSTATVSSMTHDPIAANSSDSERTYVNPSNLHIAWDNAPHIAPPAAQRTEYRLRIDNYGAGIAYDTKVTVILPNGVTFHNCATNNCTFVNQIITVHLGDLQPSDTVFVSFFVTANQMAYLTAEAFVHSSVVFDPDLSNNRVVLILNTHKNFMPYAPHNPTTEE